MEYYIDKLFVGEIDFDSLLTETQIDSVNVSSLGKIKIYVYGAESKHPHMHLFNDSGFESCLMLYEPKYFVHGSKNGTFNSKQLKVINNFLRSKCTDLPISNWQLACVMWDRSNNDHKFKYTNKQPDYTMTKNLVH